MPNMHNSPKKTVVLLFEDSWDYACGYARAIAHELATKSTVIVFNPFVQYSLKQLLLDKQKRAKWLLPFHDKKIFYIPNIAFLPFQKLKIVKKINTFFSFWLFRCAYLFKAGIERPIMWYFSFEAVGQHSFLQFGKLCIYDRPDQVASIDVSEDKFIKLKDKKLIKSSSLTVVNSQFSYQYARKFNKNILLAPWGMDTKLGQYSQVTSVFDPLPAIPHPRLGMIGSIDHRLDTELLYSLASTHPKWHFLLIGKIHEFSPRQSELVRFKKRLTKTLSLPNVHHLQEIPHRSIPPIIRSLDVGLILYDSQQEFVKGSNPIKMYEYLACGIPAVSTQIPMAEALTPYVATASSTWGYAKAIKRILNSQQQFSVAEMHQIVLNNTWKKHVSAVLTKINALHLSRPLQTS